MDELVRRFADLSIQCSPSVIEAAKAAAHIEGLSMLIASAGWLAIAAIPAVTGAWLMRKCRIGDEVGLVIAFIFIAIGAIIAIIAACTWINPWTWTAIYHPEVWIARRVMGI